MGYNRDNQRKEDLIDLSNVGFSEEDIKEISQIYIVACGSAYHVGITAQYVIEDLANSIAHKIEDDKLREETLSEISKDIILVKKENN